MNRLFFVVLFSIGLLACRTSMESLKQYSAIETYPEVDFFTSLNNKKALVVVAHDDDMCNITGTLSKLNKEGWEIGVISMPQSKERNEAHQKACFGITDTVMFFPLAHSQLRNHLDTTKTLYAPFPKELFAAVFNEQPLKSNLIQTISTFKPSIIFTLDSDIGAYGNPEHVFISSMVLELAKNKEIQTNYIFQAVYTKHMTEQIMSRHAQELKKWGYAGNDWENAKKIFQVDGMPEPTVQVTIENEAVNKMKYLMSYNERERTVIGFFIPDFEKHKASDYFHLFNREFFKVIPF